MPSVDITHQPTVVEATNDTSVVSFSETQVTVEVPNPVPVVEFASAATLVPGTGLAGGGYLLGNVTIGLSAASVASLLKADTAVQPGANLSGFVDDVGLATDAEVAAAIAGLNAVYQPVNSNLTAIAGQSTTVFGRSFLDLADAAAARTLIGVYSTSQVYTKSEVNALVAAGLTPVWGTITGSILDQGDLQLALSAKSSIGHAHAWGEITGKPTTFAPSAHTHVVGDITGLTMDHGGLTGLADDDHPHYLNNARGDARYSALGHTHDYAPLVHTHSYLPLAGGFLTGAVVYDGAGYASFRNATNTVGADIGLLGGSADAGLYIYQRANAIIHFGTNNTTRMTISNDGIVNVIGALRVGGTDVSLSGHTHSYLSLAGGTLTGDLLISSSSGDRSGAIIAAKEFTAEFGLFEDTLTPSLAKTSGFAFRYAGTGNTFSFLRYNDSASPNTLFTAQRNSNVIDFKATPTVNTTAVSLADHTHDYAASSHTHNVLYSNSGNGTEFNAFHAWNAEQRSDVHPTTGWHYGWRIGHGDPVNYYNVTFAVDFFTDTVSFRRKAGGVDQTWRQLWHTGNFNPSNYLPRGFLTDYRLANADSGSDSWGVSFNYLESGASNKPPGTDHAVLTMAYSANWFSVQMAGDWRTNTLYTRTQQSGSWGSWATLFSSANLTTAANLYWNNAGGDHGDVLDFNSVTHFGPKFLQASTNGPGTPSATQYYTWSMGLGSNYAYSLYAVQFAIPRTPLGGNPVLSVRFRENGTWGGWNGINAVALRYGSGGISPDNGTQWRIATAYGYGDFGPANAGYFHMTTGATYGFYFGNDVVFGANAIKYQRGQYLYHDTAGRSGSIGRGTATPLGGSDGDIYFQYT